MNNIYEVSHDACVGCGACSAICPVKCIEMKTIGCFFYPEIDEKKCIKCGKCKKTCEVVNKAHLNIPLEWHVGYTDKEEYVKNCTSGGICAILSEEYLNKGYNVYAARFDDEWNLVHSKIESKAELNRYMGSKYMQSSIASEVYCDIMESLRFGEKCLFIGTPCQVAGVKEYLYANKVEMSNLLTVDFMCHGVPSPVIGKKYLNYLEEKKRRNISVYNFRSKKNGWGGLERTIIWDNGEETTIRASLCPLHSWFGKHLSIRRSCFMCMYRKKNRVSDITVADFWGVEKYYPLIPTKQGVSAIQINSIKGKAVYKSLVEEKKIISEEVSEESVWDRKTALKNFDIPSNYIAFNKATESMPIKSLIKAYPPQSSFIDYVKEHVKTMMGRK